jgi:hypothetical protein
MRLVVWAAGQSTRPFGQENCLQTCLIAATFLDNAQAEVEVEPKLRGKGVIGGFQDV